MKTTYNIIKIGIELILGMVSNLETHYPNTIHKLFAINGIIPKVVSFFV